MTQLGVVPEDSVLPSKINCNMKRHISICKVIDCRSVSGIRIQLSVLNSHSFFMHFSCTIETNKGLFKSCILRASDFDTVCQILKALEQVRIGHSITRLWWKSGINVAKDCADLG